MLTPALLLFSMIQAEPVKIAIDVSQVPELKEWAEKAKVLCEEWYPRTSEYLATPGFKAPREFRIVFEKDKKGVADTSGAVIRVAADWVKKNPGDWGMVVHEMVHVVQSFPRGSPGWVTEGVADYVRYFQYEKKAIPPKERRGKSYKESYRTAASFLAWVAEKHDKEIVRKLNAAGRAGNYKDDLFKEATGQDLETLWKDYLAAP